MRPCARTPTHSSAVRQTARQNLQNLRCPRLPTDATDPKVPMPPGQSCKTWREPRERDALGLDRGLEGRVMPGGANHAYKPRIAVLADTSGRSFAQGRSALPN